MMATLLTITILNLEISGPSKKTDRARHWGPDTTDIAIISCILDKLLSADSGSSRCMIHCKPAQRWQDIIMETSWAGLQWIMQRLDPES